MLYTRPKFTLPASGSRKTQREWDYATMSKEEFTAKYPDAGEGEKCSQE
jgi:hypothetical protein